MKVWIKDCRKELGLGFGLRIGDGRKERESEARSRIFKEDLKRLTFEKK